MKKEPQTALLKNQLAQMKIEAISNEGFGIGRVDGCAVFVPGTAIGDEIQVRIVKPLSRYAFGRVEKMLVPSPDRVEQDCAVSGQCGGCSLRQISYERECEIKEGWVKDSFERLGKITVPHEKILPSPQSERYRNKAQYPVRQIGEKICIGFFAPHSHRPVECSDCLLQPAFFAKVVSLVRQFMLQYHITGYDEEKNRGVVRHLYLRLAEATGEWMLCLVIGTDTLSCSEKLIEMLKEQFPNDSFTVVLNIQKEKTNVILSPVCKVLYGKGSITDILCGVKIEISPLSFYQVNRKAAEQLYGVAREYAGLTGNETLLDLYCGAGTIGLSMADAVKKLIGVEIVPQAVENARENAIRNQIENAEFYCADAGKALELFQKQQLVPDVAVVDPPRKGCGEEVLSTLVQMQPKRIVMVSCNSATAARDCAYLVQNGYRVERVRAVDLFPRTANVETVVLLSKGEIDSKRIRVEFPLDDMEITSFREKATYPQIKEYVLEQTGLKVSSLYISQIKRKCGMEVGDSYNKPKSEDAKVPQCPPEKEKAIMDALRHFGMIS